MSGRPAAFLDRDGIVNRLVDDPATGTPESPYDPDDVELEPGVIDAIEGLASAGYALVVASNQPAAAKGIATSEQLRSVHGRAIELLGPSAARIESWRYCHHHPDAADPDMRDCSCRKPAPGLLLDAADDLGLDLDRSWMIGDADRDIEAGIAAGCRTALVENPQSAHRRRGRVTPDVRTETLRQAIDAILRKGR